MSNTISLGAVRPYIGDNGNWWIGDMDTGEAARGVNGANGKDGERGISPTVEIAETITGEPGSSAKVENIGDETNMKLLFTLPRGIDGLIGGNGKSAYDLAVQEGFKGTLQKWLDGITTIVEGENILNRSVIGVSGALERKVLTANAWTRIKFIPNCGNLNWINSNGAFVVPKDGVYKLSAFAGIYAAGGTTWHVAFQKGQYQTANLNTDGFGFSFVQGFPSPQANALIQLKAGETISFWAQAAVSFTPSGLTSFAITLDTSINLNTWDLYEQWKAQESAREGIAFDEWAGLEMAQFTNGEVSALRHFLSNGVLPQ